MIGKIIPAVTLKLSALIVEFSIMMGQNQFDNDIFNSATISSDSLNFILTDSFTRSSTSFSGFTNFNNLGIITAGYFVNEAALTVNNFNVTAGGNFVNYETINANDFNVTAIGDFTNQINSTIDAGIVLITTASNFNNSSSVNADILDILLSDVTGRFTSTGSASADTFTLSVAGDFDYTKKGTITTNAFNLNVGGDFSNNDSANDFTWGANDTLTVLGSADITADSFNNSGTIAVSNSSFDITAASLNNSGTISANSFNTTVSSTANNSFTNTGGVLNADTFALSVAGDFDYVADYLNNGTITTNAFNLTVGGDFSNNDAANDLDWGANDTLTVLGSASVTADSFSNSGTIAVSNSSFDITATDFTNSGTISANSFNTTVSSTANNSFTNTGGVLNATAFALSVAGDFDYVADFNGTITTNAFNLK